MNERIREIAIQAEGTKKHVPAVWQFYDDELEKLVELIKQAIWDDVKEELMEDVDIDTENDPMTREYLRGCNGGTVDALYRIKQFGVDPEIT